MMFDAMKKRVFGLFLLLGTFQASFAQVLPTESNSCTAPSVSHWSLGLKVGPAYVSGLDAFAGASLDYSINPFVGFGLEGDYFFQSDGLQGLGYGSLNLSNLLATYRSGFWKRANIFMVVGGGARFETIGNTVFTMAGMNAEYNLSKAIALELGAESFLGGRNAVVTSIGLRYKFCTSHKLHARNVDMCTFIPKPAPIVITETKGQENYDQINARIKVAEQQQTTLIQNAQKLADDLNALQNRK